MDSLTQDPRDPNKKNFNLKGRCWIRYSVDFNLFGLDTDPTPKFVQEG